jgi:hypothetical protein
MKDGAIMAVNPATHFVAVFLQREVLNEDTIWAVLEFPARFTNSIHPPLPADLLRPLPENGSTGLAAARSRGRILRHESKILQMDAGWDAFLGEYKFGMRSWPPAGS